MCWCVHLCNYTHAWGTTCYCDSYIQTNMQVYVTYTHVRNNLHPYAHTHGKGNFEMDYRATSHSVRTYMLLLKTSLKLGTPGWSGNLTESQLYINTPWFSQWNKDTSLISFILERSQCAYVTWLAILLIKHSYMIEWWLVSYETRGLWLSTVVEPHQ